MGDEDRIEDQNKERYRWLLEMLQVPVLDTFQTRNLAELETPDGFLNHLMVD